MIIQLSSFKIYLTDKLLSGLHRQRFNGELYILERKERALIHPCLQNNIMIDDKLEPHRGING